MSNNLDKEIKKYIRDTRRLLLCPKDNRRDFLNELKNDIEKFISENDSENYSDILNYFGSPDELVQTYLESISPSDIAAYKIKRKFYISIVTITISFLFIGIVSILYIFLQDARQLDIIYIEENISIEEDISIEDYAE